MSTAPVVLIAVLLGFLAACDPPPTPSLPDRDLIVVDLSTSLSDSQRRQLAGFVLGFVVNQATNADVSVLSLDSDMGNRSPLVRDLHPPASGTSTDLNNWQRDVRQQWANELKNRIDGFLKWPKVQQNRTFTSCYIASAVFANQYFARVSHSSRERLIWIGDLIEDCPLQEYRPYRLPDMKGAPSFAGLNLDFDALKNVEITGAIVPRDLGDGEADTLYHNTVTYWETFSDRFGLTKSSTGNVNLVFPQ